MKFLWIANSALVASATTTTTEPVDEGTAAATTATTEPDNSECGDTGGTCALADAATGVTGWAASAATYLAGTDALDCDAWRGETECIDGRCMCSEAGVCSVSGQCGGDQGGITCGGTANGAPCLFPFTYLNTVYEECTEDDNDGSPWCMVAGGLQWGNCDCMSEDCVDNMTFIDERGFNCTGWEGFYCPGAPMYGYTTNGTDAVLDNCGLTCKVCFPPPPTPGANEALVFIVSGSVSFTVAAADAEAFQDDGAVEVLLETAIQELAGDLAMGVEMVLVSGGEVEGLTAFCENSDCVDEMVLKLEADLPENCAASACTSAECCTNRAECSASACAPATHVLQLNPPETCQNAECWQEECCDFRDICSSIECPSDHTSMINPALCQTQNCTVEECCVEKGTCGTGSGEPSSGPSSGPREDWMGCQQSSHVYKASLPDFCEGADCTTHECCDVRGTCIVIDCPENATQEDECEVTDPCDPATHIPKDRDGEPCQGAECDTVECCNARDACSETDCADITDTHTFVDPSSLCWGAECSESECCQLRAECALDACDSESTWKLKSNPPLCAGTSCTDNECCEWYFDGYSRTSATLTTEHADTTDQGGPQEATEACTTARDSGTCAGITCNLNDDQIAVAPCYLRDTGTTGSGDADNQVSFVAVVCRASDCPSSTHILMGPATLPDTCVDGVCTQDQCCDARETCGDWGVCPASHMTNPNAPETCAGASCFRSECCVARDTCELTDCTAATHVPLADPPQYCAGEGCVVDSECCDQRATCTTDVCGDTHIIKPVFLQRSPCAGPQCTLGECCNARGVCAQSTCLSNQVIMNINTLPSLCRATRCEPPECCDDRATCSAEACGDTHVLMADREGELCETAECTAGECCEPRDQCRPGECETGFLMRDDFPSLCEGAECAASECCEICPFAGFWQSTNVFGGDALQVSAPNDCHGFNQDVMDGSFVHIDGDGFNTESDRECSARCVDNPVCTAWGRQPSEGTCWLSSQGGTVEFEPEADRTSGSRCESIDSEITGWKTKIVSMPMIEFTFSIGESCTCEIGLDALTLARGQMSDDGVQISWDTILNNDVWIPHLQDRRLSAKRNYEIRDGGIVVLPQQRRLQQQDMRMDFEIQAASASDALTISGLIRELTPEDLETKFNEALSGTEYEIGAVYQISDPETEQTVIQSNNTITSGAPKSFEFWTWLPVTLVVAAMF